MKKSSRFVISVLLVIGVLIVESSTSSSQTALNNVCVNKQTGSMRYLLQNSKQVCNKTEVKLVWNQTGVVGATGATGATGVAGATGATGATGAGGSDGATGATGANGTNGAAGASSPTGFTARSVCGSNGTTLCAVGVQGPGGGTIVYVDSTNEIPGYDYLEVAPADASAGVAWSTTIAKCGTAAGTSCRASLLSDAGTALNYIGLGTGRAATAAIVARHDAGAVAKASYAAGVADAYTTATASDWFLPSKDELNEVCKYALATGQAAGAVVCSGGALRSGFSSGTYWSSSEVDDYFAWSQTFFSGGQVTDQKSYTDYVRPVRAF